MTPSLSKETKTITLAEFYASVKTDAPAWKSIPHKERLKNGKRPSNSPLLNKEDLAMVSAENKQNKISFILFCCFVYMRVL